MAKKYNNFRVGGSPSNVNEDYAVWTNDLLERVIASKTVIQPGKSTQKGVRDRPLRALRDSGALRSRGCPS